MSVLHEPHAPGGFVGSELLLTDAVCALGVTRLLQAEGGSRLLGNFCVPSSPDFPFLLFYFLSFPKFPNGELIGLCRAKCIVCLLLVPEDPVLTPWGEGVPSVDLASY